MKESAERMCECLHNFGLGEAFINTTSEADIAKRSAGRSERADINVSARQNCPFERREPPNYKNTRAPCEGRELTPLNTKRSPKLAVKSRRPIENGAKGLTKKFTK